MEWASHTTSDAEVLRRRSLSFCGCLLVGVSLLAQVHRLLQGPAGCFLLFTHSAHVLRATRAGRSRFWGVRRWPGVAATSSASRGVSAARALTDRSSPPQGRRIITCCVMMST